MPEKKPKATATKGRRKSAEMSRLKGLAEKLFIEDAYSLSQIGEELIISANTLTKWKVEGDWEHQRDYLKNAPHRIEKLLLEETENLAMGGDPKINSDALSKVKGALDFFRKERNNPQIAYSILKELDNFTAQKRPELARENLKLHRLFIQHKIEQHG
ncbi:MAG: hypothetical protein RIE86_09180 [Imperialibacter sp.]|uniref:hypothetical protein n=1 Tax=Imperialibacter sp. TaxID=2038411 RepID=UPI0032EE52A2